MFYTLDNPNPIRLKTEPRPLAIAPLPSIASPAKPAPPTVADRAFANAQRNSRLAAPLPAGRWRVKRTVDLPYGTARACILATPDRILVQGTDPWHLLDREGRLLASGYLHGSEATLDPDRGRFFVADPIGLLQARGLGRGEPLHGISLIFGQAYTRIWVRRRGDRFIVASRERRMEAHQHDPPRRSMLEAFDLREPPEVTVDGLVASVSPTANRLRDELGLVVAGRQRGLVAAYRDAICFLSDDLEPEAVWQDQFEPLCLSVDEMDRVHVVVRQPEGYALWIVSASGTRNAGIPLELSAPHFSAPPVIGWDHAVYVASEDVVSRIDPGAGVLWQWRAPGPLGGLAATGDHQLLVAAGNVVGAFAPDGRFTVLCELGSGRLGSAPLLTDGGDLLVTSAGRLHWLRVG